MEDERPPTSRARMKCAKWLAYCLEIGYTKSQLDELEKIWWTFKDRNGNLKPSPPETD